MKKLVLTCTLAACASVVSLAQSTQTGQAGNPASTNRGQAVVPEKVAEMRANRYRQQLELTDDQYKGIYAAELDYVKQDQQMRAKGNPVAEGPAQQLMMVHDQKFKEVLTAGQYAKYDKMRVITRPGSQAAPNSSKPGAPGNH